MEKLIKELEVEKKEINDKISKIDNIIISKDFKEIGNFQKECLEGQKQLLSSYVFILDIRIKGLNKN